MLNKGWIPAAVAAAAIAAGGAQAQTRVNGGFANVNNGFSSGFGVGANNGFAAGSTFGPSFFNNSGFVDPRFANPQVNNFDPRLMVNGSSLGFTPGVTPGNFFVPNGGNGFVPLFYGPGGYSGP